MKIKSMHYKLWIGGKWTETGETNIIKSPFSGTTVALIEQAGEQDIEKMITEASLAFPKFKNTSRYARSILLKQIADKIELRKNEFINVIVNEAGKPISLAEVEVNRAITNFYTASEETKRYAGDLIPADSDLHGIHFDQMISFFTPRGIVLGISPFNFPLNLVVHKVAPALAIGACIILKPSPEAPGAANLLAEIFLEAAKHVTNEIEEIPFSAFQVIHCSNELASRMVEDKRISVLSFTGSDLVGWNLYAIARKKKVCLELGGNAAVIVHRDADIQRAVSRSVIGAFSYSGQVCISVQRIIIHKEIYSEFKRLFLEETEKLVCGDPTDKNVIVGPLINRNARDRIFSWIEEAKSSGAILLTSINALENVLYPVVLESVSTNAKIFTEEVFGPVVLLDSYETFPEAIEKVNDSRFGLQVGVFTDSDWLMQQAINDLDVGSILFNEVPSFRADHMPYGGVKDSGLGREGIRFAMEEFSERKTIIKWRNQNGTK
ncbi:MAG: aldehyde dehydrogenase family protein [Leptospiraceae bacterium]|nr:aldehyde dehydrogenase family protein [Leptospiraceae bacterium]